MARICEPGIRLRGPFLREMAHLAHTEYELVGRSTRGVLDILRETLFAPTVTGSPMPSACAVIDRYERGGRGYYSGVLALVGRDDAGGRSLDSAILIRTADIRADGRLSIAVGATVVRDSVPAAEAAETRSKAATLIRAVGGRSGPVSSGPVLVRSGVLAADPEIRRAVARRNDTLSTFWLADNVGRADGHAVLAGRRVDVIDAEDAFSEMIRHHLAHLGAQVTVYRHDRVPTLSGADLVVVGPGPGDPTDRTSARITAVRRCVLRLLHSGRPLLAVCLGHQILADVLGLPLLRRPVPNQGVQLAVELSGRLRRVAFYNTFVAHADTDTMTSPLVGGPIRIDRDQFTGDVHRLGGATFESVQFHPESILTEDGLEILADAVWRLSGAVRRAG
jgi:phenazine biosynthesis protein phzE